MHACLIREARSGDGPGIALVHRETSAYYAALAPDLFNVPEEDGLVDFLEPAADDGAATTLFLVAVHDGEIAGCLYAEIQNPDDSARFQSPSDLSEVRLFIQALGVRPTHWRHGIATMLVEAAEAWGRQRAATVALCDTWLESPVSLPFWQEGMGYRPRAVRLRKRID